MKSFTLTLLLLFISATFANAEENTILESETFQKDGLIIETVTGKPFTGEMQKQYKDKNVKGEVTVKEGKVTASVVFDKDGNKLAFRIEGDKTIATHYAGEIKARDTISKDGKIVQVIQWYSNGKKREEWNYKNGKTNGKNIKWHKNGQIRSISYYKNGSPTGESETFDQNGILLKNVKPNLPHRNKKNNLRQISLALFMWANAHDNQFPENLEILIDDGYLKALGQLKAPYKIVKDKNSMLPIMTNYKYLGKGMKTPSRSDSKEQQMQPLLSVELEEGKEDTALIITIGQSLIDKNKKK